MEHDIFILPDGTIRFIYYDSLKPLLSVGASEVKRASNIDAKITKDGLKWFVDLFPVDGPFLGPFEDRNSALDAEVKWLVGNRLGEVLR